MTSLVRGPSGDGGELPNQAIDGLARQAPGAGPTRHPSAAVCIPLSLCLLLHIPTAAASIDRALTRIPLPSTTVSPIFRSPSRVLCSLFQEQLRSSLPHWEVNLPWLPVYEYLLCPASCIPNSSSSSSLPSFPPRLLFFPSASSQDIRKTQLASATGRLPLVQVRIPLCAVTTVG